MTARHTDQDVAELYTALRDGVLALPRLTWWQRLLDWWTPSRAAARRLAAIEEAYRQWQHAHRPPREKIVPLNEAATALGLHMVKMQRAGQEYAEKKTVVVRDA